ncbi:hypothetical protein OTU49_002093 [Cherax quadricarinatus]|uniref:Transmembrane protein n=1 Tax=Cherax quadricarinatus TaxID=27406 RepID=A0AAW0XRV5_CHEQU
MTLHHSLSPSVHPPPPPPPPSHSPILSSSASVEAFSSRLPSIRNIKLLLLFSIVSLAHTFSALLHHSISTLESLKNLVPPHHYLPVSLCLSVYFSVYLSVSLFPSVFLPFCYICLLLPSISSSIISTTRGS